MKMLYVFLLLTVISNYKIQSSLVTTAPPTVCPAGHGQPCKAKYTYTYNGRSLYFTNNNICTCTYGSCPGGLESPNRMYEFRIKDEYSTYAVSLMFCETVDLPNCTLGREALTLSSLLQSWTIHSLYCKCPVENFLYYTRREEYPDITKYTFACDNNRDICGLGSVCSSTFSDTSKTSTIFYCKCPVGKVCQKGSTGVGICS